MHSDQDRQALGFLTAAETDALSRGGVRILDPYSTLVARGVTLGAGTVIYPTVVIDADRTAAVTVGPASVLYPGCVIQARGGGQIAAGRGCELGPGGVILRADGAGDSIVLADEVRLSGGCELSGNCELGLGAQILGAISARSVRLGAGKGGHRWPVADERGAVLKGSGVADAVTLEQGQVKSCRPSFDTAPLENQSDYHPGAR